MTRKQPNTLQNRIESLDASGQAEQPESEPLTAKKLAHIISGWTEWTDEERADLDEFNARDGSPRLLSSRELRMLELYGDDLGWDPVNVPDHRPNPRDNGEEWPFDSHPKKKPGKIEVDIDLTDDDHADQEGRP